jgi:SAM-dependent methyltransferase
MTNQHLAQQARQYYEGKLADHGATARGADWSSEASQLLRFHELSRIFDGNQSATVNDYGCGWGAMAGYLREMGHTGAYCGFDISERMIEAARARYGSLPDCTFESDRAAVQPAMYTVASGIFNVKQDAPNDEWRQYVLDTAADLARLSTRGFAFNALTTYSDPEKRRADLYYADPTELFDYFKRHVSRFVTLIHDTPLYEFTLIVRF